MLLRVFPLWAPYALCLRNGVERVSENIEKATLAAWDWNLNEEMQIWILFM